jgi:hypothetical protein
MSEEECVATSCSYNNDYTFDPTEPAKFNTRGFIRIPGLPPLPPFNHTEYKDKEDGEKSNIPFKPFKLKPISELLQNLNSGSKKESSKSSEEDEPSFDVHSDINYRLYMKNKSQERFRPNRPEERLGLSRNEFRERYNKAFIGYGRADGEEENEEQRMYKLIDLSDKLRRTSYKPYTRGAEMDHSRKMKIQKLSRDVGRMCLDDYCVSQHHHVWATLIDLKTLFRSENEPELADKLLEILKEIREKFIREKIPSSGAGNHCLWE